MSPVNQEALSVIALDIGNVYTRALLFEVVEESYHYVASGITPTPVGSSHLDLVQGVLDAVTSLQEITGRIFLNNEMRLITPSQAGGEGIDRVYVVYSAGTPTKFATFGLISDVSHQSVEKLAESLPGSIVASVNLNDSRTIQQQIDAVLDAHPDLILFAGGTDRGSTRAVRKMADLILAIVHLIPQPERPPVFFCGNQTLVKPLQDFFSGQTQFISSANIRPGMEEEELDQALDDLARTITNLHTVSDDAFKNLNTICNDIPYPSSVAQGRMTQFLSKVGDPEKGVLSIDLGASATIAASSLAGKLSVNVLPYGSGEGFKNFLKKISFAEISQWFPAATNHEDALDMLWQKTLFPASVPMTHEALSVEQAAYRVLLRLVMFELKRKEALFENGYETILCSGSALTQASNPHQLLMMLLDCIQPKGVSTIILDSNSIFSTLGAVARTLPVLPVQVLESAAFANLATVISPDSDLRVGAPLMRVSIEYKNGKRREVEIKKGSIKTLPLPTGDSATIELSLNRGVEVDKEEIAESQFKVKGGICGIVIDARGRPLKLPHHKQIREELLQRWTEMLTA